jgi:hypothetical protein
MSNSNFIDNYVSYFETLARQHKLIKHSDTERHFFVMDINEVLGAMADSSIKYPAVILNALSARMAGSSLDNVNEQINGGFLVIDHCKHIDDYQSMVEAMSRSHQIGLDFLQRIHYDIMKCEPLAMKALPDWNIFHVSSKMWGPVFDNDYGWHFEFPVMRPVEIDFNPDNWNIK